MFFGGGFPGSSSAQETPDSGDIDNKEFYEIIGVPQDASQDDIKKAYRKKVIKAHPDKGGDPEEFKKLQAAYEILSNPEKRELYDKYGLDGIREDGAGGMDPFESLFGGIFGRRGRGGKPQQKKMKPIVKEIKVTLEDLYLGNMKNLTYKRHRNCEACDGKGGKDAKQCTTCKGQGMVEKVVQMAPGFISSSRSVCHDCQGEGTTFDEANKCKVCNGNKICEEEKTIEVPIEQGAPSEHHLTFSSEGDEMPGVHAGDLIVKFNLEPHKRFERKGADLYYKKTISLYEALTGVMFNVEHLDGKKILIRTAPNDIIGPNTIKELRGMGMPFYKDPMNNGNLYVIFNVEFPKKNQIKDVEKLKEILPLPKDQIKSFDKKEALYLDDFDEASTNPSATGGKKGGHGDDDDEDDGMPRGQRVQCAQQ